jgi:peptidoglycan/xylan/chitin deacetylase (PgdA/CDA1 family)
MSRFSIALMTTVLVSAVTVWLHNFIFWGAVAFAFLILMGLGVAIPQMKFFGAFICSGNKTKKQVALTFDDGPDANSTPQLLDLLRAEKIPATFFCIGKNVEANPGLAARARDEGHLVENHSFAHSNFTNFYGREKLKVELLRAQLAIEKVTGVAPKLFRPPVGLSNPNTFRVAQDLNLQVIGWNIRSLDTVIADPQKIVARIRRGLRSGAVILLHDGKIPAEKLLATVKSLLDELRKLDYQVVRLDELLK